MNQGTFLRRASFRKLNKLSVPALGHGHLLSVCECAEKSGHPGPHHDRICPCYATHRVELLKCDGVWEERRPTSRGHYRKSIVGPIKLVIKEIGDGTQD